MNQGLFFGQLVIGPAGCGKVTTIVIIVNVLQTYARNGLNPQKKHHNYQSRSSSRKQRIQM